MSLTIRTLTEADIDGASAVLEAAYGHASFKAELRRCLSMQPDGWRLALRDGEPVGGGGAICYGPFAYVGLVGVHPTAQRQGIGWQIMEQVLAWVDSQGCPVTLLDASEAGAPLYARLGFEDDDQVAVFVGSEIARRPFLAASPRVSELRPADFPAIVAYDAPRFGAERSKVLASYLRDDPARSLVTRDDAGRITGFLCAQPYRLGPWIADTGEDAEALLAYALTLPFDGPPTVLIPAANRTGIDLLARYGFSLQRSLRHMRQGGAPLITRRVKIYGQASFALG